MNEITLKEARDMLDIQDFSKDNYIQEMIEPTINFVRDYCENPSLEITNGVKIAVVKIIEFYMNDTSLASLSISRISKSFLDVLPESILILLKPYDESSKVKFL